MLFKTLFLGVFLVDSFSATKMVHQIFHINILEVIYHIEKNFNEDAYTHFQILLED